MDVKGRGRSRSIQNPGGRADACCRGDWLTDEAHAFPRHRNDRRGDQGEWHDDEPCDGHTGDNRAASRQAGLLIGQAYEAGLDVTGARGERPRRSRNAGEVEERRPQRCDSDALPSGVIGGKLCEEPYVWQRGSERREEGRERPESDATDHEGRVVALAQVSCLMGEDGIELARVE